MNLRAFWEAAVRKNPGKVFLYYGDEKITYSGFDAKANQAANAFLQMNITKGERVCLMLPNIPEFLYSWFALAKIGGAMVPINNRFKASEAQYIVNHSEAKGLVVHQEYMDVAVEVKKNAPHLEWIVAVDGGGLPGGVVSYEELTSSMPVSVRNIPLSDEDLAAVIYTSGTTGFPKGAMHVQKSFVLAGQAFTLAADLHHDDRLMIVLPLYHVNAEFYSTMGTIAAGASLVVIRDFSASRFWEQAVKYGVTQFNYIGAVGRMLMARPASEFRPGHRIRVANGAGISPGDYEAFVNRFKIPNVIDGYGLTEVPRVCQNPIGRVKLRSMGLPAKHPDPNITFTQMKVVDDNGKDVPAGITGELMVKSPAMMRGYFKDPEKTKEAIKDGWFCTGDFAYMDEDSYFYFVDRKKDIIRRRGENISAREVETVINENPKVVETAVIAVPSELSEDEVMAVVVLRPGETMAPEDVILWCKDRLASFKVPRYLLFRTELPRTPTQRTQKNVLKEEKDIVKKACDMEKFKASMGL